jgi:phosphomevalonate kinase
MLTGDSVSLEEAGDTVWGKWTPFVLPERYEVILAKVGGGSDTRVLVSAVQKWFAENGRAAFDQLASTYAEIGEALVSESAMDERLIALGSSLRT